MGKKSRRSPFWIRAAGWMFYLCICVAALGAGTALGLIGSSKVTSEIAAQKLKNTRPQEVFQKDSLTMLVLGCDVDLSYGGKKVLKSEARSDMMMVTKIDFRNNRISGVSIPRDTLVAVEGYRAQKINAYHAIGGRDMAVRAVETLLPVHIDKVVTVDYVSLQKLVDLVGGVEVYIPRKLKYTDKAGHLFIDLKPGKQILDGYNAMCYVRHRHDDSDFHRSDRQKEFMMAFKDQVMKNPARLPQVADKIVESLGADLTPKEAASLALFAQRVGHDNIKLGTIPVVDAGHYNYRVDSANIDKTLKEYHLIEDPDRRASLTP